MSATAAPVADCEPDASARAQRHMRLLAELAEIGMELARALGRAAARAGEAGEAGDDAGCGAGAGVRVSAADRDLGLSFSRVSRAVRLTLAMEARVAEGLEGLRAEQAQAHRQAAAVKTLADFERACVAEHREQIEDAVEQAIAAEHDAEAGEALRERLHEALDEAERLDDFLDRPVSVVVATICAELGLTPDWSLWAGADWADADWADEEAGDAAAGSPYGGADGQAGLWETVSAAADAAGPEPVESG